MAHKTFISYKYSEAQGLRDRIIKAMGADATYYQGETSESPDLTDTSTDNIKKHLRDMMFDTSVTIVIISPHMKESKWIDWEIEYSLKKIPRNNRTSQRNGIVGVIMKVNGNYDWFRYTIIKEDGHQLNGYKEDLVYPIISNNRRNQNPLVYHCEKCQSIDSLKGSYISFIDEDTFLEDIDTYINNAFDKSENDASGYDIMPTR